jgi:transcriptional regulator with XRE-family HTH domain
MSLNGAQVRAARELIGLYQPALAVILQLGVRRIADFESGNASLPRDILDSLRAVCRRCTVPCFFLPVPSLARKAKSPFQMQSGGKRRRIGERSGISRETKARPSSGDVDDRLF